jgi:sensor domain CHASE-containing protein
MFVFIITDYIVGGKVIFPWFLTLEQREAKKNIGRCVDAIARESYHLDKFTGDWSNWDDTYEFAVNRDPNYILSNLVMSTFKESNINLLLIADIKGQVIWKGMYDNNQQPISIKAFDVNVLSASHPVFSGRSPDSSDSPVLGIFVTEQGPMIINAKPILSSEYEGPSHGTIIMGRLLDDKTVETLIKQTQVKMQIRTIGPDDAADVKAISCTKGDRKYLIRSDKQYIKAYTVIPDISGAPALMLCAFTPPEISQYGRSAIKYIFFSTLFTRISIVLILLLLLQKIIIEPITTLTNHIIKIGRSDDLTARININHKDEIGVLANEFNETFKKLAVARKKLLDMTYDFGKTEMAAGILHNIRNSLTPVVTGVHSIQKNVNSVHIDRIQAVKQQLSLADLEQQRRADLEKYLVISNELLMNVFSKAQKEIDDVAACIENIESFFMQRDLVKQNKQPAETVSLRQILDDSIKMVTSDLLDNIDIHIDQGVESIPSFVTERISLIQIFGNLIINAAEAIKLADNGHGTIDISANIEDSGHKKMLHIKFQDNGQGMADEQLKHAFERGFSTKRKSSLSGVGLHWCANALIGTGGKIWLDSQGPDKGASAHIMIPFATEVEPSLV